MKKYTQLFLSVIFILLLGIVSAKAQNPKFPPNGKTNKTTQNQPNGEKKFPTKFVVADVQPVPLNLTEIKNNIAYPAAAKIAGIEGTVIVRIFVDEKGNYVKHTIISSSHPLLYYAVEEHISKIKFSPCSQAGTPIKFWTNIPFNFYLDKPNKEDKKKRK